MFYAWHNKQSPPDIANNLLAFTLKLLEWVDRRVNVKRHYELGMSFNGEERDSKSAKENTRSFNMNCHFLKSLFVESFANLLMWTWSVVWCLYTSRIKMQLFSSVSEEYILTVCTSYPVYSLGKEYLIFIPFYFKAWQPVSRAFMKLKRNR